MVECDELIDFDHLCVIIYGLTVLNPKIQK